MWTTTGLSFCCVIFSPITVEAFTRRCDGSSPPTDCMSLRSVCTQNSSALINAVANGTVTLQPTLVHSGEHGNVRIHIVIDLDDMLIVVQTMQPTNILLKSSLPGDRHRQEESIQAGIVESLTDIAACRKNHPLLFQWHGGQRTCSALT